MKSIRLPEDIQQYVRKKDGKRIAVCMLAESMVIVFLLLLGNAFFAVMGTVLQVITYIVLLLLPFYFTGVPFRILRDRNWHGTVRRVDVETRFLYTKEGRPRQYAQNIVILTLEDSDGKIFEKEVAAHDIASLKITRDQSLLNGNQKFEHYMNEFSVGDEVYHFHGLDYPLVIGPNYKERKSCVVCGQETKADQSRCWNCGHTLIKVK